VEVWAGHGTVWGCGDRGVRPGMLLFFVVAVGSVRGVGGGDSDK